APTRAAGLGWRAEARLRSSESSRFVADSCRPSPRAGNGLPSDGGGSLRPGQPRSGDVDERADRRVGPHLAGRVERHLDASEALWKTVLPARERVQSVATVEVADPLNPGVVVVAA